MQDSGVSTQNSRDVLAGLSREYNSPEAVQNALIALIPTLNLPITARAKEPTKKQINEKENYITISGTTLTNHSVGWLDSKIDTDAHAPFDLFTSLVIIPYIFSSHPRRREKILNTEEIIGIMRAYSSAPGIIEPIIIDLLAALPKFHTQQFSPH